MRRRRALPPIDARSMAEASAFPGSDPRIWATFATVDDEDFLEFTDDYGPLVHVTTQPYKSPCVCRVGMFLAGDGEAEFVPFVAGDEVLVVLPEGRESAGGVIVARLNNSIDRFPKGSVAGQDPATNSFAFRRHRTAFVHEAAGPYTIRQATTDAFLSFDAKGIVTLRDGQKAALQLSPDAFGYQSGDARFLLQLDLTGGRLTIQADDALLVLSSSKASPEASAISVPGKLSISTAANPAAEHAISAEATCNLIANVFNVLGAALNLLGPAPLLANALGALLIDPVFSSSTLALGVTAAGATSLPGFPVVSAALAAAFGSAAQKPPGAPGVGQLRPGVGCPGLMVG